MAAQNASHPYFPRSLTLPLYRPNDKNAFELLGVFFGIVGAFIVATWWMSGRVKPRLSLLRRIVVCWFVACGLIHSILEGYFSFFHATLVGKMDFLAQMWKEYGRGDSRYISSDPFTVCMERITALVDGPLAFMAALSFMHHGSYRYILQLLLSLFQLYGDSLYFLTEIFEGFSHGEYLHPQYFWFYFVFLNSIWIVVPLCLIFDACCHLGRCQAKYDSESKLNKNKKLK